MTKQTECAQGLVQMRVLVWAFKVSALCGSSVDTHVIEFAGGVGLWVGMCVLDVGFQAVNALCGFGDGRKSCVA